MRSLEGISALFLGDKRKQKLSLAYLRNSTSKKHNDHFFEIEDGRELLRIGALECIRLNLLLYVLDDEKKMKKIRSGFLLRTRD